MRRWERQSRCGTRWWRCPACHVLPCNTQQHGVRQPPCHSTAHHSPTQAAPQCSNQTVQQRCFFLYRSSFCAHTDCEHKQAMNDSKTTTLLCCHPQRAPKAATHLSQYVDIKGDGGRHTGALHLDRHRLACVPPDSAVHLAQRRSWGQGEGAAAAAAGAMSSGGSKRGSASPHRRASSGSSCHSSLTGTRLLWMQVERSAAADQRPTVCLESSESPGQPPAPYLPPPEGRWMRRLG
jgi:hypothetical protein